MRPATFTVLARLSRMTPLVLVSLLPACASTDPAHQGPAIAATPLVVANRTWRDVDVYDAAEPSTRLGRVTAFRRQWLVITRDRGPVRLVLKPRGSAVGFSPEAVWVAPGQVVEVDVNPLLEASELRVRFFSGPARPHPAAMAIAAGPGGRGRHLLRGEPQGGTVR